MPTYKTPGVYLEEISKFPPSVVPVETAIPAFIGYTEKTADASGNDLKNKAQRITSLLEFEELFGAPHVEDLNVDVKETAEEGISVTFNSPPSQPRAYLAYGMRLFYGNSGGPCYVITLGDYTAAQNPTKAQFETAITALEGLDEPTLLVFPDACKLSDTDHGSVVDAALKHCSKMEDRFTIADVRDAVPTKTDTAAKVTTNFRGKITSVLDEVKYGAAYFPYVVSNLSLNHKKLKPDGTVTYDTVKIKSYTGPNNIAGTPNTKLDTIKTSNTSVYNAILRALENDPTVKLVTPPSPLVAGVYARTDSNRGVWKAPAGYDASLSGAAQPAVLVTNDINDLLNVDATSGKSVNAIREFRGRGTLVWGARTLAGNDNENRYVPVRRFLNFAEESVKKAVGRFVFDPNDANTWTKVRTMIENFLIVQWRDGALQGAKPEHAFYVKVGLNQTMSAQDILDGYMIVEIGLAIVRPAEFIVLRFSQMMPQS